MTYKDEMLMKLRNMYEGLLLGVYPDIIEIAALDQAIHYIEHSKEVKY